MTYDPYGIEHPFTSLRAATLLRVRQYSDLFVETGTNVGHGVQLALDCGFGEVHSIESVPDFYVRSRQRFASDARVHLHLGHSPDELGRLLTRRAVVYLDAHSVARNPLLEELRVISESPIKNHVVLIDDVRMFDTVDWHRIKKMQALELLYAINPGFQVSYEDTNHAPADLLVAEAA